MVLSLKPERLRRYKDVVALFVKYGRSDLVRKGDLALASNRSALALAIKPKAEEFADDLEKLV